MDSHARAVLEELLHSLPPVRYACAYGSAARRQPGGGGGGLDLLLAVDHPAHWHNCNIARHRSHYGPIVALGGGQAVASLASRVGAGVHFNSMVPFHGFWLKYGVMRTSDMLDDLRSWCRMYSAGRLQKPVEELVSDASVTEARQRSLRMALAAALLQLPQYFSREELRETLVSLSYAGDIRMTVGAEDRLKVQRIAGGSSSELDSLYAPAAASLGMPYEVQLQTNNGAMLAQDAGEDASARLLLELPYPVLVRVAHELGMKRKGSHRFVRSGHVMSIADVAHEAARNDAGALVARAIGRIVRWSSARQSVVSVLATGPVRGVRYLSGKVKRALGAKAAALPSPAEVQSKVSTGIRDGNGNKKTQSTGSTDERRE